MGYFKTGESSEVLLSEIFPKFLFFYFAGVFKVNHGLAVIGYAGFGWFKLGPHYIIFEQLGQYSRLGSQIQA